MIYRLLTFILLVNWVNVQAQYKIDIKIKGAEQKNVQFGYYYADKQYVLKTEKADEKGKIVFQGKEKLARGLYLVMLENQMYFDVLVSDDQEFSIECDTSNLTQSMKIKGSTENAYFYEFQQEIINPVQERGKLSVRLYELPKTSDSVAIIEKRISEINTLTENAWKKYAQKSGNSFLTNLLTAFNGEPEFAYSNEVFFEHINFADSGLVRSPALNRVCKLLLARNLNANKPISIMKAEIIQLLEKSKANKEVYAYVFTHFLSFFHSFQRDGINELFVFLHDEYIAKGKTPWFDEKAQAQIKEEADVFRYSLIGSNAYNINLESLSGEQIALNTLEFEHIFVFFWSTGCGHCEEASKILRDFMAQNKTLDLAIYAVYVKEDRKAWADFVSQYGSNEWFNVWDPKNESLYKQHYYISSTPIMYVLDRNKKIINKFSGDAPIKSYLETIVKNEK